MIATSSFNSKQRAHARLGFLACGYAKSTALRAVMTSAVIASFSLLGAGELIAGEVLPAGTLESASVESISFERSVSPAFDWTTELIKADVPTAGHRFNALSASEHQALRRGFKLSLDAIAKANSPSDLVRLAEVRPLPDPTKPFLPVGPASAEANDPFGQMKAGSSLGPLGRMFALEGNTSGADVPSVGSDASEGVDSSDPFSGEDDAFGPNDSEADLPAADDNSSDSFDDSDDLSDPFGDFDEDPFG